MSHRQRFDGGVALGRAHILSLGSATKVGYHLGRSVQYLRSAGDAGAASAVAALGDRPTSGDVAAAIGAAQAATGYPDQHSLDAGINIGWAIETCAGREAADVHAVVDSLERARGHAIAISANDGAVNRLVNTVVNPIKNLVNAQHPKPRELPQHMSLVEQLQTNLRAQLP